MIVDDHAPLRTGLRMRLARERDLTIVGESGDVASGVALASRVRVDIALVDLALPDGDGFDLVQQLHDVAPDCRCLILTLHDTAANRERALAAGIAEFVGKHEPTEVLLAAIRRVASGAVS